MLNAVVVVLIAVPTRDFGNVVFVVVEVVMLERVPINAGISVAENRRHDPTPNYKQKATSIIIFKINKEKYASITRRFERTTIGTNKKLYETFDSNAGFKLWHTVKNLPLVPSPISQSLAKPVPN